MKIRSLVTATLAVCVAVPALADEYGKHPFYLHAISDLQAAKWQMEHRRPEDPQISGDEMIVRDEIQAALGDLQHAAWQDGKAMNWNPPPDAPLPREGRLHAAVDLLRKAHADVAREEDDPRSRPFQQRGLSHVDAALGAAQHAIGDVRRRDRRE